MFEALVLERCRAFVRKQSEGEGDDAMIEADAKKMAGLVLELVALKEAG